MPLSEDSTMQAEDALHNSEELEHHTEKTAPIST
jgi:hypothetical protein